MMTFLAASALAASFVSPQAEGVEIVESNGVARIAFDVRPAKPFMFGNYPRLGADIELLFREPLSGKGHCRFAFDAKGLRLDGRDVQSSVELRVILEDGEGEVYDYFPKGLPGLKRTDRTYVAGAWDSYVTGNWFAGEAGAVSHDLCVRVSGSGNGRPDGEMKVLGYRLHLAQRHYGKPSDPQGNVRGEVLLADGRALAGYPPTVPFVFADSFCKAAGTYRFRAAASTEFQDEPRFGVDRTFDFAPGDRVRLAVPVPADGMYWLDWELADAKTGARVAGDSTRREVRGVTDGRTEPAARLLRVTGGRRGVFAAGEPYELRVLLPEGGLQPDALEYTLRPYYFTDVLARGAVPDDGRLSFPRHADYSVFRLTVEARKEGRALATAEYLFGERPDSIARRVRAGLRVSRADAKKTPYNRLSIVGDKLSHAQRMTRAETAALFRKSVEENRNWIQHYTVCIAPNHTEVLPGVWDFSLTDLYLDTFADFGTAATVRPCHSDRHDGPYRWTHSGAQWSFDGEMAGQDNPYGSYCGNDPEMLALWKRLYRALFERYRDHAGFEGYYLMDPAGESVVLDAPWSGILAGYGPVEQTAFRAAMEEKYGTVAALNAAWGTAYGAFADVSVPQPTFDGTTAPDRRPAWVDFMAYKATLHRRWAETLIRDIRSYDEERIVIGYFPPTTEWLFGLLDFGHNGGNHSLDNRGAYVRGWKEGGIGWITEPIHPQCWAAHNDPGKGGWTLDVSVWTMLAQAGGGGANLHIYTIPGEKGAVDNQGGVKAFDRMEAFFPILKEVHDAELIVPPGEIAFNADSDTMWQKHRTVYFHRRSDLIRWRQLIEREGFLPAEMKDFPDRRFKLVCPNVLDEVISRESFARYVRLVKEDGAKLVMSARTGRFVTGSDEEFPLLKAFGITQPKGPWRADEEFEAVAGEGNPLMPPGRVFAFETLARLSRERKDESILKNFWRYPYRWLPETDYFGCYPDEKPNGETVATFARTGGAAMTRHAVGKGEVVVYWGLPAVTGDGLKGTIAAAARWAGIERTPAPVPDFFEMSDAKTGRHYGFFYRECEYGEKTVLFPNCPDGTYFADDMLSQRKLGRFTGRELREQGIGLVWEKGLSPLKCIRIIPKPNWFWANEYRDIPPAEGAAAGDDLVRLFARAKDGGSLRAVAIGGSITQAGKGWIGEWLAERFPKCRTMTVNAGMSATGSSLGVFRLGRDVTAHRPDLVLIEFCVNDGGLSDEDAVRYVESVVVRLKSLPNPPAIAFVGAASRGRITFARHRKVAEHYGLKFIDLQEPLERELAAQGLEWKALMSDDVHPNEAGHRFYAKCIAEALEPLVRDAERGASAARRPLPPPLSAKRLILDGEMVSLSESPRDGWTTASSVGKWWDKFMTGVLQAPKERPARYVIPFRGTAAGLFYPMDPAYGRFYASVDGREPLELNPGARFGYESRILGKDLMPGEHTITVVVPSGEPGAVKLAYLMVAGADEPAPQDAPLPPVFEGDVTFKPVTCGEFEWRRSEDDPWTRLAGEGCRVDFTRLAPGETLARAFLRLAVESPVRRTARIAFAIDYFGSLRVNGRTVHEFKGGYGPRQRVIYPVELEAGQNELVFEIRPGSQGHACELAWVEF